MTEFWVSFLPAAAGGVASAAMVALLAFALVDTYRKLNLSVAVELAHGSGRKKWISLFVVNHGRLTVSVGDVQWILLFDPRFFPREGFEMVTFEDAPFVLVEGDTRMPILPGGSVVVTKVPVVLDERCPVSWEWLEDAPFYCSLRTRYGHWCPHWLLRPQGRNGNQLLRNGVTHNLYRVDSVSY